MRTPQPARRLLPGLSRGRLSKRVAAPKRRGSQEEREDHDELREDRTVSPHVREGIRAGRPGGRRRRHHVSVRLRAAGRRAPGDAELAETGDAASVDEKICWGHCAVNCECRCALRFHVVDDEVAWVETDNTGDDTYGDHQLRACQRGRSIRRWINHPDRLTVPLKRVGKRGEGKFRGDLLGRGARYHRRGLQEGCSTSTAPRRCSCSTPPACRTATSATS